jgi:hypothetical protein
MAIHGETRVPWAQHYDATETQVAVIREALGRGLAMVLSKDMNQGLQL